MPSLYRGSPTLGFQLGGPARVQAERAFVQCATCTTVQGRPVWDLCARLCTRVCVCVMHVCTSQDSLQGTFIKFSEGFVTS